MDRPIGEAELEMRLSSVQPTLLLLLHDCLRIFGIVAFVRAFSVLSILQSLLGRQIFDGVDEHLCCDVFLVRLSEVEAAMVKRQVIILLLDFPTTLSITLRPRTHLVHDHLLAHPLPFLLLQSVDDARNAVSRVQKQELHDLLIHSVVRVDPPNSGELDCRQRIVVQSVRSLLLLLQCIQFLLQQMKLRNGRSSCFQNHIDLKPIVFTAEQRLLVLIPSHVLRVNR